MVDFCVTFHIYRRPVTLPYWQRLRSYEIFFTPIDWNFPSLLTKNTIKTRCSNILSAKSKHFHFFVPRIVNPVSTRIHENSVTEKHVKLEKTATADFWKKLGCFLPREQPRSKNEVFRPSKKLGIQESLYFGHHWPFVRNLTLFSTFWFCTQQALHYVDKYKPRFSKKFSSMKSHNHCDLLEWFMDKKIFDRDDSVADKKNGSSL